MTTSITSKDVLRACSKLGVDLSPSELPSYTSLLQTTDEAFLRLLAMSDYHPPTNTDLFPRKNVHKPSPSENVLGVAWAHTFSIKGAHTNSTSPLAGKTFCLKDNICVMGVPQVNGTDMIEPYLPAADATVVTRILEAGGEIIGTATCENMSYSPSSNTSSAGVVENPHAKGFSAGGSSSGVGALVGSPQMYVDMGIGCDQGGSIRIPAAMCGAVGLKPTHGLVPYTGIVSSEYIMDHVGPICRNVMDTAVLLDVVAGRDGIDDRGIGAQEHGEITYSADLKTWFGDKIRDGGLSKCLSGMRVGILEEAMNDVFLKPEMKEKVYAEAYRLRELGAVVEHMSIPGHATGRDIWMGIRRIGGCLSLQGMASGRKTYATTPFFEKMYPLTQDKWDKTPPAVKATLINGTIALEKYPGLYGKCLNMAIRLGKEYDDALKGYDVFITPTLSCTAPRNGDREASALEKTEAEKGLAMNTAQFNLTGHPAMTLPIGFLPDMSGFDPNVMLPVGMQIVGPLHGEDKIFKVGYAYEKMVDENK